MKKLLIVVFLLFGSVCQGAEWKVVSKTVGPYNELTHQQIYTIWFETPTDYQLVMLDKVPNTEVPNLQNEKATKMKVEVQKNDKLVEVINGTNQYAGQVLAKIDFYAEKPIEVTASKYKAGNWFKHKITGQEGMILQTMQPKDESIYVRFRSPGVYTPSELPKAQYVYPSEITLIATPKDAQ